MEKLSVLCVTGVYKRLLSFYEREFDVERKFVYIKIHSRLFATILYIHQLIFHA